MNEDENGITPPDVTAMTLDLRGGNWHVTIEQGNGDVIKEIELTPMESVQLGMMLSGDTTYTAPTVEFVDVTRKVPA